MMEASHNVYIICEENIRFSFVACLSATFRKVGISVFLENDEVMIKGSRVCVVVITESPAPRFGKLVKALERQKTHGHLVVPVFYGGLHPHVTRENMEWQKLLLKLAGGGLPSYQSSLLCTDLDLVDDIVGDVYEKLFHTERVGVYSKLVEIQKLIHKQPMHILQSIGIWGKRAIGKTTLAKAYFDYSSSHYDACFFVQNFDETLHNKGLDRLLEEHFGIVIKKEFGISSCYITTPDLLRKTLCSKKVLLLLDGVYDPLVVKSFLENFGWLGPTSTIITSSIDKLALQFPEMINQICYEVRGLNNDEAIRLFSRSAYGKDVPEPNLLKASMKVIVRCNGFPLFLHVSGRELKGKKSGLELEGAFYKLCEDPPHEIQNVWKLIRLGNN